MATSDKLASRAVGYVFKGLTARVGRLANAADRTRALDAFIGSGAKVSVETPVGASVADIVGSILNTSVFRREILGHDAATAGHSAPLSSATLEWAKKALPLTDGVREQVKPNMPRDAFLALVFSDPVFIKTVCGPADLSWSPAQLLPKNKTNKDVLPFVQNLLGTGSPLIDRVWLSHLGITTIQDADNLVKLGNLPWFKANSVFDGAWYCKNYGLNFSNYFEALAHYDEFGESFSYSPNPFLNLKTYSEAYQDLFIERRHGRLSSVLAHMILRESAERRSAASHFDTEFYLTQVSRADLEPYGASAFAHYVDRGWSDGLQPNPCFDQLWYLRTYPDAMKAVKSGKFPNAFSHFVLEGEADGLLPCVFFDPDLYLSRNDDLAGVKGLNLFRHYWSGRLEGRDFGGALATAVARNFLGRLPDSLDILAPEGLTRLSARPEKILGYAVKSDGLKNNAIEALTTPTSDRPEYVRSGIENLVKMLGHPSVNVEHGANQLVHIGDKIRLYVSGAASFPFLPLREVRVASASQNGQCTFFRHARLGQETAVSILGADLDDLKAGFLAWFDFSAVDLNPGTHRVSLSFVFGKPGADLERVVQRTINVEVHERPRRSDSQAKIQVAMASYNAPLKAFRRQVDSILANPGAHLLISDDASPPQGVANLGTYGANPRVEIDLNARNEGFISNFERSLYMCSPQAEVILFSDQDDVWRPDKIETLVKALKPGVACSFSDMRITTDEDKVISETFWNSRCVHYADAISVGVANTVTGAASAFPASLVPQLAPFPRYTSGLYHDQWLAVLAAAVGEIAYVSKPLYDYVQHGGNVLGFYGSRGSQAAKWSFVVKRLRRARRNRKVEGRDYSYIDAALEQSVSLFQRFVMWNEALLRVPVWSNETVRRVAVEACDAIQGKPFDAVFLRREWGRLARRAGGEMGLLCIDDMFESILLARWLVLEGHASMDVMVERKEAARTRIAAYQKRRSDKTTNFFETKIEPVPLAIAAPNKKAAKDRSQDSDLRVNMFIPELVLERFFGGYHSKISLITRLEERGVKTRLILLDEPSKDDDSLIRIIGAFPELRLGLERTEIVHAGGRNEAIEMGARDALVATTWWSAYVANDVRVKMGRERFLYFIQEFEPFTFSLGTWYRAAEQSYEFPHDAIFSTSILDDYFKSIAAGVYSSRAVSEAQALAFRNPITGLKDIERVPVAKRKPRLLFYARTQPNEARNMYEFGLAALRLAVSRLGDRIADWELIGVGADRSTNIPLDEKHSLRLIQKLDSYSYREMLASSDVGLALMYTPHPSLVPIEMAAAGMITVTNACMSKDKDAFAGISDLIQVAEPNVEAIAEGLVEAIERVLSGAVVNPAVDWPTDPQSAFPDVWMDQFEAMALQSLKPASPTT